MKYSKKLMISVYTALLLTACAGDKKDPSSAEELYNQAYTQLEDTSYNRAAKSFEQVELEYPYSKWAVKAKLMSAYAYYRDKSYDDAIISLDRFIKFHPGNQDIAYAYYLKALCYYDQITSVEKDQSVTLQAMEALNNVILRFSDTDYAKDARAKIDLTVDHLAGKEMEIGRYYLQQQNYLSALNRFSEVVSKYQTTSHIEEALYRQTEIYSIMGLNDEAGKAAQVLIYNYPDSQWSAEAKKLVTKH